MSYIDSDTLTMDAPALNFSEWGGSMPISSSIREAWESGLIQVSPNKDRDQSYWLSFFSNKREWFSLLVLNAAGDTIMHKEKRCREGDNLINLDASSLSQGTYNLRILTDGRMLSGTLKI